VQTIVVFGLVFCFGFRVILCMDYLTLFIYGMLNDTHI
jgi:hypothetical protein